MLYDPTKSENGYVDQDGLELVAILPVNLPACAFQTLVCRRAPTHLLSQTNSRKSQFNTGTVRAARQQANRESAA